MTPPASNLVGPTNPHPRRIDHVVVAVRDLDAAADVYRRLGLQVGKRNRHPWGTENRLIQFRSSFIELITLGSDAHPVPSHGLRQFSFGAFIRDYLQAREGFAMLSLSSNNAEADAALFARTGAGDFSSFFFERTGLKPDGVTPLRVAFSLAFAQDPPAPHVGFFVCQQHSPENFWNPDFQVHPNRAGNIVAVTLRSPAPDRHRPFLSAFTGQSPQPSSSHQDCFALAHGQVNVLCADTTPEPILASFTIAVASLAEAESILKAEAIPFTRQGNELIVATATTFGVEIRFRAFAA